MNPSKLSGKVTFAEELFPIWTDQETWSESFTPETAPVINYPKYLQVDKIVSMATFYELDAVDATIDPKAKKKETKKPAKGSSEPEMVELLVNDNGKTLPQVYKEVNPSDYLSYPPLKDFLMKKTSNSTENEPENTTISTSQIETEIIDPLLSEIYHIIARFTPLLLKDTYNSEFFSLKSLQENYLWRAIYPKLSTGKPCYNPAGKYAIKLYFANQWRKVYVDDTIPLLANGQPAIVCGKDMYELWPLLLAKGIYTVLTTLK